MDLYRPGDWAARCDRCGARYYASQLRKEWTGLRVCSGPATRGCWEPRHPQDFVKGKPDHQAPPWVRPDQPAVFTPILVWDDEAKAWVEES